MKLTKRKYNNRCPEGNSLENAILHSGDNSLHYYAPKISQSFFRGLYSKQNHAFLVNKQMVQVNDFPKTKDQSGF